MLSPEASSVDITNITDAVITVTGDVTQDNFYVGETYGFPRVHIL